MVKQFITYDADFNVRECVEMDTDGTIYLVNKYDIIGRITYRENNDGDWENIWYDEKEIRSIIRTKRKDVFSYLKSNSRDEFILYIESNNEKGSFSDIWL